MSSRQFFRRLPAMMAVSALATLFAACMKNNVWEEYETWRKDNNAWYEAQVHRTNQIGRASCRERV